jgi:hypothetical protein
MNQFFNLFLLLALPSSKVLRGRGLGRASSPREKVLIFQLWLSSLFFTNSEYQGSSTNGSLVVKNLTAWGGQGWLIRQFLSIRYLFNLRVYTVLHFRPLGPNLPRMYLRGFHVNSYSELHWRCTEYSHSTQHILLSEPRLSGNFLQQDPLWRGPRNKPWCVLV